MAKKCLATIPFNLYWLRSGDIRNYASAECWGDVVRIFAIVGLAIAVAGCVTTDGETVSFQPKSYQQAIMRDGDQIITSRGRSSIVSLRPATHLIGDHPTFIVGIQNVSKGPLDFRVSEATAGQIVDGASNPLRVYTYDELVSQEQNAQVGRVVLTSVLMGVNAGMVGDAADVTNAQMAANVSAQHQQNLTDLDQLALKDHTLMAGENYAGKLTIAPPANTDGPKTYFVELKVGPDRHNFAITQAAAVR